MKEIDPKSIVMTWNKIDITGIANGTFLEVEYAEDAFTDEVGADGEVTRIKNADERGSVTFHLGQASETNDLLSAMAIRDRKNSTGYGALLIKDLKGTTLYAADEAWIQKIAKGEHAKGHTNRSWIIRCAKLRVFVGGSTFPNSFGA